MPSAGDAGRHYRYAFIHEGASALTPPPHFITFISTALCTPW
jgi:hypothetical protein